MYSASMGHRRQFWLMLIPILEQVKENRPEYSEAYRLHKFLQYFESIPDNDLPPTSLLREFLGGSSFTY